MAKKLGKNANTSRPMTAYCKKCNAVKEMDNVCIVHKGTRFVPRCKSCGEYTKKTK